MKGGIILFWQPEKFILENNSIWSFKERGIWATHKGDYRGNCCPQVPRNLLLKYTKEDDIILDPFCGSGTTLIEAKLLKRYSVGIDVNENAIKKTNERVRFKYNEKYLPKIFKADSTNLNGVIKNDRVDFVFAHPPYADIIKYSDNIDNDISLLSVTEFLDKMNLFSKECFRILKKDKFCSILIGDIRKNGNIIPLGSLIMNQFINSGFTLKEIIIKEQHNCKMTSYWKNRNLNFYLLAHEYIYIFKK